jgi:hypothetical protein
MTTALDTSCSEKTMVLSARRGFLHMHVFSSLQVYQKKVIELQRAIVPELLGV